MMPAVRKCKSCQTPLSATAGLRCDPCEKRLDDWLEDTNPAIYRPRRNGTQYED